MDVFHCERHSMQLQYILLMFAFHNSLWKTLKKCFSLLETAKSHQKPGQVNRKHGTKQLNGSTQIHLYQKNFRLTPVLKNDGGHVLYNLYTLRSKGHYSDRCILQKCFEEVSSCTLTKTSKKGCMCAVPPRQRIHANVTQQFLPEKNFEVISHAFYSPDLAPRDFWLFPTMKDTLRGRTFTSRAVIASSIF